MTKVSMTLQYPKTIGDAAVVRLEQIWKAVEHGELIASDSKYGVALQSWRASAADIIAKADASAQGADWDRTSQNEIKRLRKIERAARRALASNRYNPSQIEAAMEDLSTALGPDREFEDD